MKQEINPKMLIGVVVAGVLVLGAVAFFAFRAPTAAPVAGPVNAADSGGTATNATRRERGRDMAKEMREMHGRGRREDR